MKTNNQQMLENFNSAFAQNDIEIVMQHVTDDIIWTFPGNFQVRGKEAFRKKLESMSGAEPQELVIHKIITHGTDAAANGVMKSKDGKEYGFCDIYTLRGFKNSKISEMTSYAATLKT